MTFLEGGARTEHQRAHHACGAPSAIHERQIVAGHLPFTGLAHDLASRLHYVPEATGVAYRLAARELPAVGIDGKGPLVGGVGVPVEVADLTLLADSRIFEAHGREDGVSVVEFGELHLPGAVARHLQGSTARHDHRAEGDVLLLPDGGVGGSTDARA